MAPAPSAHVVGNAFVQQYYHVLQKSPELVFRFYQDSSVLTRPGLDGVMKSVSTMHAINDMIVSLGYKDCKVNIKTVDTQNSLMGGVIVSVTGCLTGKDNVTKKFMQSFFLAPQDIGYYVLNDVFRYFDEDESPEEEAAVLVNNVTKEKSKVDDEGSLEEAPVLVNVTSEERIETAPSNCAIV